MENRFAQYRRMSGGRFLVSLHKVKSSEKILLIRSLIKENINFWEEKIQSKKPLSSEFIQKIADLDTELQSVSLDEDSTEVAYTIAGYAAKKLIKRLKCTDCQSTDMPYFHQLSRGGLTIPSWDLANIFCTGFAILDAADHVILQHPEVQAQDSAEYVLSRYVQESNIGCSNTHSHLCKRFGIRILVNIFYNNKQRISSDAVRKEFIASFKKRQRTKVA